MAKMRAALWYGPEDLRLEETDIPSIERGEVLVKIETALTCGTDFKLFRSGHPLLVKSVPSPLGHEMVGHIVETGENVERFKSGDRVIAANSAPCDTCFYCSKKQWNLCENLEFLNGAFADFIRIPARIVEKNLYHVPEHVSAQEAAAAEPLACTLRCMEAFHVGPDDVVCVIGSGPCGLLLIQLAKYYGAKVLCVSRSPEKLKSAKKMGADHTLSVLETDNIKEAVYSLSNQGYGPDFVIEAVGRPETWELATSLVRKGGRVCFYGGCPKESRVTLDTQKIHYEELSLGGVFHHTPAHISKALELISEGKVTTAPLVEGKKRLAEINTIFRKGMNGTPLKFAVVP